MGTQFRPCIDLHDGKVKQIVGGTLQDTSDEGLKTNFVAKESPGYYAALYRNHQLTGAHVIKLGPGNDEAAREALQAWPNGLQLGGGITIENAKEWISYGASKVIVTSWLFPEGVFQLERLQALSSEIGKDRLVVDLSCRRTNSGWSVAINRWQTMTEFQINQENLSELANYCSEFLVHAADVEGLCKGIDQELVQHLGALSPIPVTYAGGANSILDLPLVHRLSNGRVDLSFGSALDIFGGHLVTLTDCVQWNTTGSVPQ